MKGTRIYGRVNLKTTNDVMPIRIRSMKDEDTGLLCNTFFETCLRNRTLPYHVSSCRAASMSVFDTRILNPDTKIAVAVNPFDDNHIFGWAAIDAESRCIHFVYVRSPYRNQYVAMRLLVSLGVDTSKKMTASSWGPICEARPVDYRPKMLWSKR